MTQMKKIIDSSKFVFSINIINISFYSIGTGTSTFLAILKKLEKLNQGWFYIFGVRSSKINSIISKILVLLNIIGLCAQKIEFGILSNVNYLSIYYVLFTYNR